jgi:hypothetical protein
LFGTCWGAKITALNSREGSPFKASAQARPSLLDLAEPKKIAIPMIILPSLNEEPEVFYYFLSKPEEHTVLTFIMLIIDQYVTNVKEVSPLSYNETFSD